MKKLTKKGEIELQLNWILVLVIGGIILFFFIAIVSKQKAVTELQVSGEIVKDLDTLISGAQSATGSASIIPIPNERIEFSCSEYRVSGQRLPLRGRTVFGSSVIEKGEGSVIVWSLPWNIPYTVTDFLYVTSPGTKYVFAYQESETEKYSEFVDNFVTDKLTKEKANIDSSGLVTFEDSGNNILRVIIFGDMQFNLPDFAYKKGTTIIRFPFFDPELDNIADIAEFYVYDSSSETFVLQGKTSYINKESLIGAIISDNVLDYSCIMEKAWASLHAINKVQWEKAKILHDSGICSICYEQDVMDLFSSIDSATANPADWANKVADVYNSAQSLDEKNSNVERLSMPLLY